MSKLHELAEDEGALLALEPEELALLVLREFVGMQKRNPSELNRHNFSLQFKSRSMPVQNAIMEAWAWLETSGAFAQRPGQQDGWFFVTRRGYELAESGETVVLTRAQTLPRHLIHPLIEQKVWSSFLRGDYDGAVFVAFKQVEIAVRDAGGFAATDFGQALARKAFHPATGPLTDSNLPPGEQQALSELFSGALGSYKNPQSHRNVNIADACECAEMVILASHLLKIVDARKAKLKPPAP